MTSDQKQIWKALSDPTRRALLDMLRDGPMTTGALCERFGMSRIGVIKHLNILREGSLVLTRKEGRTSWNYLNAVPIRLIYERWVQRYEGLWAENLVSMKKLVESKGEQPMKDENGRGFSIEQEVTVNAPLDRVWSAFTKEIDVWWKHRLLGNDSNLSLEPAIGGHFLERNGDSAAVWGTVTFIKPQEVMVLQGALGMQRDAVASTYSYEFNEENGATRLKLRHVAFGTQDHAMAEGHRAGWEVLWDCLKAYVEKGTGWRETAG